MSRYSKREVALIAELLADKLIDTYQGEQIAGMVDGFISTGFTKTALEQDPAKLFQMLVIAAYDRRPFTGAAGGFEVIWGMRPGAQSIPQALNALSLFTLEEVRHLGQDAIHRRLDGQSYFGCSLATDDGPVRFARTLLELVQLIETGFHHQILTASTAEDVQTVYRHLTGVHGIGDTIGAKLVKYLLREIGIGRVPAGAFPLTVVWPITSEYHVSKTIERLSARLDKTLVPLTMGLLLSRQEPFSLDALFYLHRNRNWELDEFIEEARSMLVGGKPERQTISLLRQAGHDVKLAQKLLAVIREIYEVSRGISPAEIKRAGLGEVISSAEIEASARRLYVAMEELATQGKVHEMMRYYQNCLNDDRGKIIGWALQEPGRISMESEADRFRAIYQEDFT